MVARTVEVNVTLQKSLDIGSRDLADKKNRCDPLESNGVQAYI